MVNRDIIEKLPIEIKKYLENKKIKKIVKGHHSGDLVYQIDSDYILKISNNIESLQKEKNVNDYLLGKVNVSKSVEFIIYENKAHYLKTMIKGESLITRKFLNNPEMLIEILVNGLKILHGIDVNGCNIFNAESIGNVFIHGDFCLPNILYADGNIGFIDLQTAGLGDPWVDYAWCIWSLEYNLKTDKYTSLLLEKLDIKFDKEKYNKYIN